MRLPNTSLERSPARCIVKAHRRSGAAQLSSYAYGQLSGRVPMLCTGERLQLDSQRARRICEPLSDPVQPGRLHREVSGSPRILDGRIRKPRFVGQPFCSQAPHSESVLSSCFFRRPGASTSQQIHSGRPGGGHGPSQKRRAKRLYRGRRGTLGSADARAVCKIVPVVADRSFKRSPSGCVVKSHRRGGAVGSRPAHCSPSSRGQWSRISSNR